MTERDGLDRGLDHGLDLEHGEALRGALASLGFGACVVVVGARSGLASVDVGLTFAAAWTVLTAVVSVLRGPLFVGGSIVAVVVAAAVTGPYPPLVAVVVVAAGVLLARLMQRGRPFGLERALRIALQSLSLLAGLFVVVTLASHPRLPALLQVRFEHTAVTAVGAFAVVVGLGFTVVCLRHLVAGGGTADPFDPPLSLCRSGPYSVLRHPMQLGQIVVVVGMTLLAGTVGAVVVAAVVAVILVGPVRAFEARQLGARFDV